eukprot:CAMPEP_0174256612 /NCGR_PEP_ID=MMETSP0439-20130205/5838_1 /TAXON_ID=0 /ORGANISM="Stereomyxa ramosa, Strain Chinc5" /LENGTH=249 /DNA_ID=CAMNT_0015339313 /DNA_START=306 /DNA_END=1055 /DNA_ORIENTATION=-
MEEFEGTVEPAEYHETENLVLGTLRPALKKFLQDQNLLPQNSTPSPEIKFSIIFACTDLGVDVYVILQELLESNKLFANASLIKMPKRKHHNLKDSSWFRERNIYKEYLGEGESEVIMATPNGDILEGMSSNVFVLKDNIIFTAPDNLVLAGTMRKSIITSANNNDMHVCFESPNLSTIDNWDAIAISSTSRMLQGISKLRIFTVPVLEQTISTTERPFKTKNFMPSDHLALLQNALKKEMEMSSTLVL